MADSFYLVESHIDQQQLYWPFVIHESKVLPFPYHALDGWMQNLILYLWGSPGRLELVQATLRALS